MEEVSGQGSLQSGIDLLTLMITELLRDPVCYTGDWEGARPWPRPVPAGWGPNGVDDSPPVEKQARKTWLAPSKAGALFFPRHTDTRYIALTVTNGFGAELNAPEYRVELSKGDCQQGGLPVHVDAYCP